MAKAQGSWWRAFQVNVYDRLHELPAPPANPATLFLELHHGRLSQQVPGIVRGGVAWMAETLGWKPALTQKALDQVLGAELLEHDPRARVTYLPGRITEMQPPKSWKNLQSYLTELAGVPDCQARRHFLREMLAAWEALKEDDSRKADYCRRTVEAFPELAREHAPGASTGSMHPMQGWEADEGIDEERESGERARAGARAASPPAGLLAIADWLAGNGWPAYRDARSWAEVAGRLREGGTVDEAFAAARAACEDPYHRARKLNPAIWGRPSQWSGLVAAGRSLAPVREPEPMRGDRRPMRCACSADVEQTWDPIEGWVHPTEHVACLEVTERRSTG